MSGAEHATRSDLPADSTIRRYRYSWFLLSLIALIMLAPITERVGIALIAHQVLFTIVVLLALNATTDRRSHLIAAAICGVSWLILDWAGFSYGRLEFRVPPGIALICLLFVVLYDILLLLLQVRRTDRDVLSAAIAAYLLLGVAWATSFDVIERIMPGSFAGLDSQHGRSSCISA